MPFTAYEYDGDPNGVVLGDQGDRCSHTSKNIIYTKTGGLSRVGWVALDTETGTMGTILQTKFAVVDVLVTSDKIITPGDVVAQVSQGEALLTGKVTPKSKTSTIYLLFSCGWTSTIQHQDGVTFAIFRQPGTAAISQVQLSCPGAGQLNMVTLPWFDLHGSAVEVTYQVRFGPGTGSGTASVNGPASGRRGGGKQRAILVMQEVLI